MLCPTSRCRAGDRDGQQRQGVGQGIDRTADRVRGQGRGRRAPPEAAARDDRLRGDRHRGPRTRPSVSDAERRGADPRTSSVSRPAPTARSCRTRTASYRWCSSSKGRPARATGARPVSRARVHIEILDGLAEGEQVVIGSYRAISRDLRDGSEGRRQPGGRFARRSRDERDHPEPACR